MDIVGYTTDGETVYEAVPEGWEWDEDEEQALRDEHLAGIGWSDCRM